MNFENEINYAKHLENVDFSKDENYFSNCVTLVRYWRTEGIDEKSIAENLEHILKNIYYDFGDNMIFAEEDNILKIASAKGLLQRKIIEFSKEELDFIHSFNHLNFEKMLFIMFCAYKVEETGKFTVKAKELMRFANNGYSKKYVNDLLSKAYQSGLFDMDCYHNTLKYFPTEKTLSLFNPDNIILTIDNFKNLIFYYLQYIGIGNYTTCKNCGCIIKRVSNNQKYCDECKREARANSQREYAQSRKQIV
jgi:hypothetical protein